jgi:ATP/ADP translocase
MATATATFSTIRNLGSAISVVVGSVIFQNQMMSKQDYLRAELGPIANAFGGGSASASVGIIQSLPDRQRKIARDAFSSSLSTMWITYVAFSALGLFISAFISKNVLEKEHVETRTGMEEEEEEGRGERGDGGRGSGSGSGSRARGCDGVRGFER